MTRPAPGPQTPVHSIQQPLSISTLVHVALALFTQSSALRLPALAPNLCLPASLRCTFWAWFRDAVGV